MILINNNWEQINSLHDISKIIRENYNEELAEEMDKLIPKYTDEEYEDLEVELCNEQEENLSLDDENDELRCKIRYLKREIKELKGENNEKYIKKN